MLPFDGEAWYAPGVLPPERAGEFFDQLFRELVWRQPKIVLFGRRIAAPRLEAWYGDPGARYRYSGLDHEPQPWTPALAGLRSLVERASAARFNSVLANLYRNGDDSNGWHADDERELGAEPTIASLSLGTTRRFLMRHRRSGETVEVGLESGSLLVMAGRAQQCWKHSVPKERRIRKPRINLTFRFVFPR